MDLEQRLTEPNGLADRLRNVREQASLAGKDLAGQAGWAPSKVSRLENGKQMPSASDVDTWTRICGADTEMRRELMHLLDQVQVAHRDWKRRFRAGQAPVQRSYNQMVAAASEVVHFETAWVPGLVQTREYALAVLAEIQELHGGIEDIDAAVATRMQRQQYLYDLGKRFEFLLCEPVLRWMVRPAPVMIGQLDRLLVAMDLPNVRFGVLPLGVKLSTTPQSSFQRYDDVVVAENFVGETLYQGEDIDAYKRIMDRLWSDAQTGDDARYLIMQAAERIRTNLT